ncbi:MAG TPA: OmpH family outer membrane protein [Blastocatellia bacterium]|nr:OmpH family outer membrane protein [Blastocatellia bacterium]
MRIVQLMLALAALSIAASAQQVSAPTQGRPAGVVTKGKVAFINTGIFQEQIGEFKARVEALNRQFEPRVRELQSKGERVAALENTIKTQSGVLAPAKLAETNEQLEREKREYQRKQEDLEADGNRAKDQLLGPIREKLTKFVEAYTEKRGISMLIDLANAIQSNTIVWYDPRADITQDFVTEYNKANPVATAPAPAPQKP